MGERNSDAERRQILEEARTIAVLGAHPDESRPAFYVPDYLHRHGYRVVPVNPRFAGDALWGEVVRSRLDEIAAPVDVVDVFRRAGAVDAHLEELLAMRPAPRVVWLQSGIRNDRVAAALVAAGIDVVQDHCTMADHRRFGIVAR